MIKLKEVEVKKVKTKNEGDGWIIFCPGCGHNHSFRWGWHFDGNTESPTFTPSLVVKEERTDKVLCHSIITNGKINFCHDCEHGLKGQSVDLPFLED